MPSDHHRANTAMPNDFPQSAKPRQPELNFDEPAAPAAEQFHGRIYDEAPPPEAIEVPPPPECEATPQVTAELPSPDYDETPPPETIEVPPPPDTSELSPEELDALDKLNDSVAQQTNAVPAESQGITYVIPNLNFGEMLQAIRLEHRFTIRQLSEKVHMTESTIRDLESGEVSRLNSNSNYHYCRSQIERICQVYGEGISPEPILEAFELELQKYAPQIPDNEPLLPDTAFPEEGTRRFSSFLISLVIILLLLLIVGGWAYKRYEIGRQEKAAIDYDLPSLIPSPQLPLTPLDIPTH